MLNILKLILLFCSILLVKSSDCVDCQCVRISTLCCGSQCTTSSEKYPCPTDQPTITPTVAPTTDSCINSFTSSFPSTFDSFTITNPVQSSSYVFSSLSIGETSYSDIQTYCVDYTQDVFPFLNYNASSAYPYTEVLANPSLAAHIPQVDRLNQVAWIMNNIEAGQLAISPQLFQGSLYSSCSTITSSDIQSTIWALTEPTGSCDQPSSLCTTSLDSVNICNVAYIWNQAFLAVPEGTSYVVTDTSCSGIQPSIPVVVIPTGADDQTSQALMLKTFVKDYSNVPCQC